VFGGCAKVTLTRQPVSFRTSVSEITDTSEFRE
jgi:hypothetical protein